jgi:hypothetical protein
MKQYFHLIALGGFVILCVAAPGCSFIREPRKVVFAVSVPEPFAIRFEGKGAAAGVMMSSSMGPMGVAIGAAIDEGIAKDIRGALDSVGCGVVKVAEISFQAMSRNHSVNVVPVPSSSASGVDILVQINQVKFTAFPSERDLTLAEVALTIERGGVVYELASTSARDAEGGVPLATVRTKGREACHLLQAEFIHLLDIWYQQQQK